MSGVRKPYEAPTVTPIPADDPRAQALALALHPSGTDPCTCGHPRIVHAGPLSEGCPGACGVRAVRPEDDCACGGFVAAPLPPPPWKLKPARVATLGEYIHMLVAHVVSPVPGWIFPYYVAEGPTFDHHPKAPTPGEGPGLTRPW